MQIASNITRLLTKRSYKRYLTPINVTEIGYIVQLFQSMSDKPKISSLMRIMLRLFLACDSGTEYTCMDQNQCIALGDRCNGFPNCNDGSDEVGCGKYG